MKKILQTNNIICALNIVIISFVFAFILYNLRYSIVIDDDIYDFISYHFEFFHGRIFNELISVFLIMWLPNFFDIPIQNFAFISEGATKTIYFCLLVYILSKSYNKFKSKPVLFSLCLCIFPFLILSILYKINFIWCFKINQYFTGYIGSIIFYLMFWHKLAELYTNNKKFKQRDYIIILFLMLLVIMSNEMLNIAAIILIIILTIESSFNKKHTKFLLFLSIMSIIISSFIVFLPGTVGIFNALSLSFNFFPDLDKIINFTKLFVKYIIFPNVLFIIPIILNFVFLYSDKETREQTNNIFKLILFSIIGFIVFIAGTIFLPLNCYSTDEIYKFWFLHKGLLSTFDICILYFSIYCSGYAFYFVKKQNIKISVIIIFMLLSLLHINLYYIPFEKESYNAHKETKQMRYIADKIAVHYFKKNQTAILPNHLPFEVVNGIDTEILPYSKELYEQIYTKEQTQYLVYIEKEYAVNVEKGMTFMNNENALHSFYKTGGILTDEELEKLDFSRIKDSLKKD